MARTVDPAKTAAIHLAVVDALGDGGIYSLSVEKVAKLAGVNKTTIYRRWGTIEELLVEVLIATAEAEVPVPDTGSYEGDLLSLAQAIRDAVSNPGGRVLLGSMWSSSGARLSEIAGQWWTNRVAVMASVVAAAQDRGDATTSSTPAELLERLAGPIHLRSGLIRSPMTDAELDRLVDGLLRGAPLDD